MSELNTTKSDTPFHIAIFGDFSGRHRQSINEPQTIKNRRLIEIDRDNFDDVMAAYNVSLHLKFTNTDSIQFEAKQLDDFHPDALHEKLEIFAQLRRLRRRLKSNRTFADAAAEMQAWVSGDDATDVVQQSSVANINAEVSSTEVSVENLLDNILESHTQQTTDTASSTSTQIDRLIKSIVAPYNIPASDPRQDEMIAMVDKAAEMHMREILQNSDFQQLESAWRSVWFLVKRLQTNSMLKIFIIDISKQEWQQDLAVDDIATSAMYKKFCDSSEGDKPWSVLLGNYTLRDNIEDVLSLSSMGAIAQQAGAPFLAAASETMVGCESFYSTPDYDEWNYSVTDGMNKAWQMLRQSSVAGYIGLVLPRFLLRIPYGKKSNPIESFTFEEMPDEHCHECYLWGNAAFIKVEGLARNFKQNGWDMKPEQVYQIDSLPIHYYSKNGEMVCKPIAEIYLTDRGSDIINKQGIMSLLSVKNMDCIRSNNYQSINEKTQKIIGRWL